MTVPTFTTRFFSTFRFRATATTVDSYQGGGRRFAALLLQQPLTPLRLQVSFSQPMRFLSLGFCGAGPEPRPGAITESKPFSLASRLGARGYDS